MLRGSYWSCSRGWCGRLSGGRITGNCGCYWDLHRRDFNNRLCHFRLRLNRNRNLLLNQRFDRPGGFLDCCGRRHGRSRGNCGDLGRNSNCGRWTRHRLGRNEPRRWLGRLDRSDWSRAGSDGRWLGHAARRTRRHSRRRRHGVTRRRYRSCSGSGTRRYWRVGGLLRDRLQHVSRLGDVRQVDLGLELFRLRARAAAGGGAARLAVLGVILFHALRLIHFDGAGVCLLFRDSDLDKQIENHFAFDLEFPRQVINSNLLQHSALFPPYCPVRLRVHSILTVWLPIRGWTGFPAAPREPAG